MYAPAFAVVGGPPPRLTGRRTDHSVGAPGWGVEEAGRGEPRAQQLAADWGAQWVDAGAAGHINSASQLGDWPQGHALLQDLVKDSVHGKR